MFTGLVNQEKLRMPKKLACETLPNRVEIGSLCVSQPIKIDLDKKSFPKQKTIQNFNIDAQGFRKTKNKNPPTLEIGVTS